MPHLVATLKDVRLNIRRFQSEITPELRERLSYARAWYALKGDDGKWNFGPSKFIGYRNMTATKYLKKRQDNYLDGRKTESKLSDWFVEISEKDSELWSELHSKLAEFLHSHGKSPSAKMRINIDRELHSRYYRDNAEQREELDADLAIAFIKRLSLDQQVRVKNSI